MFQNEDLELIKNIQQFNNEEDLNQLFIRYEYVVDSLARKFARSNQFDYDDYSSEGRLALYKAAINFKFDSKATFKTFAATCIRNAIVDEYRKLYSKKTVSIDDDEDVQLSSDSISYVPSDPISYVYTKEIMLYIQSNFNDLDCKIIKARIAGFPYEVISKMLNVSTKKIDNVLYKCRKIVRIYIDTIEK